MDTSVPAAAMSTYRCRITDKICIPEHHLALRGLFKLEIDTQFLHVAHSQIVNHVHAFLVDVHQADSAAGQSFGETYIAYQSYGELRASRSDYPQPD
jgi:hypothetical protein